MPDRLCREWILCGTLALLAGCQAIQKHEALVHAQLGMTSLETGQVDRALTQFQLAAKKDETFAFAYAKIGDIQSGKGNYTAARQNYARALKAAPEDFDYAVRLGRAYRLLGQIAEAARAYLYAHDLDPGSFKANLELANCYLQMGQTRQAEDYYNRALEIDPTNAEAFQNLAVAQEANGQTQQAIHSYLQSIEQNPAETVIFLNLATCYLRQNQPHLAEQAVRRAILMNDRSGAAYRQLGYCLFLQKEFEEAEDQYRRAIELGVDPEAHAGIGTVMMARYISQEPPRDDLLRARAVQHWRRSLELDPNQPRLAALVARYGPSVSQEPAAGRTKR